MRPRPITRLQKVTALLLAGTVILACNLSSNLANSSSNKPLGNSTTVQAGTSVSAPSESAEEIPTQEPDPLDHLLSMRSIKIDLTTIHPDGTSSSITVQIDSTGNMYAKESFPVEDLQNLPTEVNPETISNEDEFYVLNGKTYQVDPQNPEWMDTPSQEDYAQILTQEMHGPDGPALWLNILPLGSIHLAGKDNVGGFAADKYTVNGQVGGQSISGTIWFEPQADALVQAELTVPAVLLSDPDNPQQGELKITLNAQKADVPSVALPSPPTSVAGGTATP